MKTVVITGVSTGIGRATAAVLTAKGLRVFGSVRNGADAAKLQSELGPRFTPLVFDVTDPVAVGEAAADVRAILGEEPLFGLVNNAGIAVPGPLLHMRLEQFRHQIEVNLTGPLIVTQAFAPLLDGKVPGRIVMISSVAGTNASPFNGAYCASKFGLEGLSETLRRELMVFGIDVIVIAPGPIATPIWEKAGAADTGAHAGTVYAAPLAKAKERMQQIAGKSLAPETIANMIYEALTATAPRTRYEVTPEPVQSFLLKLLPKRWADRLYARALGLMRGE